MKYWSVSPERYTKIATVALVLLCVIVVTGAAVRLTGSGLGCEDWPQCNDERFIDVSTGHGAIEQVNRLFTGLVAAGVIAAVLAARRRRPYRADLVNLAWGLVAGVVGQVVLGGIVVMTDLHPLANQGHFVLSMILVANSTVLVIRSRESAREITIDSFTRTCGRLTLIAGIAALLTGTVVTGSGPHAGDENARRFDLVISSVARVHGATVILALLLLLVTIGAARRTSSTWVSIAPLLEMMMVVGVLQGAVGYVQYFNGIPAALVAFHIAGATGFMIVLTILWGRLGQPTDRFGQMVDDNRATVSS